MDFGFNFEKKRCPKKQMQYKGDPTLALVGCFLRDGRKILGREQIGGARATYYFLLDFFFLKCHIEMTMLL